MIITSKVSSLMARAAEYVLLTPAWELQLQDKPMALVSESMDAGGDVGDRDHCAHAVIN